MSNAVINSADSEVRAQNRVMLFKLLLIIPVMLAFCASLVPLYKRICEVLGITSTRAIAQNTQVDTIFAAVSVLTIGKTTGKICHCGNIIRLNK